MQDMQDMQDESEEVNKYIDDMLDMANRYHSYHSYHSYQSYQSFTRNPGKVAKKIIDCFPAHPKFDWAKIVIAHTAMIACTLLMLDDYFWYTIVEFLPKTLGELDAEWKRQIFNIFMGF